MLYQQILVSRIHLKSQHILSNLNTFIILKCFGRYREQSFKKSEDEQIQEELNLLIQVPSCSNPVKKIKKN